MRFCLFFFLCLVFILHSAVSLAEMNPRFYQQLHQLSDEAIRKREGIVLWTSLSDSKQYVFGNSQWLHKEFVPGSLFKLVIAQAAIENGLQLTYRCEGRGLIGGEHRSCWTYKGHASLDLPQALALSCNLYFENLGVALGLPKILEVMKQYPSLNFKLSEVSKNSAFDLALFSIGDDLSYRLSPQAISDFWKAYIRKIQDPAYAAILQGLKQSVQWGTASKLKNNPLEILAKTGTGDSLNPNYPTNGWFLGAYPVHHPQYSLLILLQEAHGFEGPSTLAQKIFSKLAEIEVGGDIYTRHERW